MHEKSQHGRLVAVNGMDPAEREAMTAAGVELGPVRHVRYQVDGRLVDTTHILDHIQTVDELASLPEVTRERFGDLTDLATERMLERAHFDPGPDDAEGWRSE
jgi:hypothetical protein